MSTDVKSDDAAFNEKHDLEDHSIQDQDSKIYAKLFLKCFECVDLLDVLCASLFVFAVVEGITASHLVDPNVDSANLGDLEDDSPYPEVRSAVANTDDTEMPCSTIRAWILGLCMAILVPGLNQFLYVAIFPEFPLLLLLHHFAYPLTCNHTATFVTHR